MDTISLRLKNEGAINKYISIIRKATGKSIAEIKKAIEGNYKVMECDYYENDEISKFILVIEELLKNGAKFEICEDDRLISLEMLKNLIQTYEEIEKEREELDNIIYGDK